MNVTFYFINSKCNSNKYAEYNRELQKLLQELGSLGFQNNFREYQTMYARITNQIQWKCNEIYSGTLIHEVVKQKERKQPKFEENRH